MSLISTSKFGDCARCGDKETLCKKRGKEMVCLSCCRTEDTQKQIEKAKERDKIRRLYGKQVEAGKEEAASRQNLINDLDYTFSRIVRLRAADSFGNCECYTCGKKVHWSLIQCGHYAKRGNMGLRWNFDNARVQDKGCNEHLGGNYDVFRDKLEAEHPGLAERLEITSKEVVKLSIDELKNLLIDLRAKLRPLEAKFKQVNQI